MAEPIASFIMSGGVGSRLWPLSREDNPKQFHNLSGDGSMLLKTVRRIKARPQGHTPIYLLASERHAVRIGNDLAGMDLSGGRAIFEPVGRNTAAAIAIAAKQTLDEHGDVLVLILPSDHVISTEQQFWQTVEQGTQLALDGRLVVFGIKPETPETGYGYIEVESNEVSDYCDVRRFVEKPDAATAETYVKAGNFFWNAGIFLFRASAMREAFDRFQPDIWNRACQALKNARSDVSGTYLPMDIYHSVPSISIDYAIMERASDIAMVPASFRWSDLGSWQSLLDVSASDEDGNVITGDVVAIDCKRSYLRSHGRLLSVIGLEDIAVVNTPDATFVAPAAESQNVKKVVERLQKSGRLETKFTPVGDAVPESGAWKKRVRAWLFDETLPLWSDAGVDTVNGGFFEALNFDGQPLPLPKRVRTTARQIYAFSVAKAHGWDGPADDLIAHGIDFLTRFGRSSSGGWVRALNIDGSIADPVEDAYDHAFILLAMAHAHKSGHKAAATLGRETFAFIDENLEDERLHGFHETAQGSDFRRANPHMHLLEAFLAWYQVTGDRAYLRRAARIIALFRSHFFDPDSWTLGEFFDEDWQPAPGEKGTWTEPGHHFEWASLLIDFANHSGQKDLIPFARKLYASAIANGLNRATGLAYGGVSREGMPLDTISRSWPQSEAVKAVIALDGTRGPDLKPEIEARVGRLFRWHIDPAPRGMWIDRIDATGKSVADHVPASIFYHLVCALTLYLGVDGDGS